MTVLDPKILAAASSALRSVRDPGNRIPVCGMYLVAPVDGAIEITATDMDLELTLAIDGVADFAPSCLPPYIVEAAAAMPAKEVRLAVDERSAAFSAGRSRFAAPILPGPEFPRMTARLSAEAELDGKALARILAVAAPAVSTDKSRPHLEGVHVMVAEGRLHAMASDGHVLHMASMEAADLPPTFAGVTVPTKTVREMVRIAGKATDGRVTMKTGDRALSLRGGRESIVSKLIEGSFPDLPRLVPPPSGNAVTLDIAEAIAAIDRIGAVQEGARDKTTKKTRGGSGVRLIADGDQMLIEAGFGVEAVDTVRAEIEGEFPASGVSGRLLRQTLAAMKDAGLDTARIDAATSQALRIESPTDDAFVAVVMMMRV